MSPCARAPLVLLSAVLPAQLTSGPEAGAALTKVDVYAPLGPRAGTTFDAAAALGQGPAALLFLSELTRNVAPMVRGLDRLAQEYGLLGFRSFTVVLADDRTAAENQIERSSPALGLGNPMVLSVDGSDGPGAYGLNRKCTLTLVLAKDGRVVRSVGFTDTGPQDVPELESWISELTGPMPRDLAGLRTLLERRFPGADAELLDFTASLMQQVRRLEQNNARMAGNRRTDRADAAQDRPMRAERAERNADRPREGKPPEDAELRELLRQVIQKTATAADLDAAFAAIDARVGDDAGLRAQAVEMFKLVIGLEYGTDDARARCKRYVDAHGRKQGREGG